MSFMRPLPSCRLLRFGGRAADRARGRSTSRSGSRMSITSSGRSSSAWSCCNCISRSSATASWPSGSITSAPLFSRRFQRRSPTRTAATTRACKAGLRGQRIDQRRRGGRGARPDHQRQLPEMRDVLVGHHLAVAVDQHEPALVLPDGERAALRPVAPRRCRAAGARPSPGPPRTVSRSLRARRVQREAEDRIALGDAECGAQQRLRRVGAALDHDVAHAQPERRGGVADALAQCGQRAPGESPAQRVQRDHAAQQQRDAEAEPAGRAQLAPAAPQQQPQRRRAVVEQAGGAAGHARHAACSTIQVHSAGKSMP